jgi:hypothetical protein
MEGRARIPEPRVNRAEVGGEGVWTGFHDPEPEFVNV